MCFSEVEPTDEIWSNSDTIVTAVNFYGSRTGRLKLEVSSSAAWSLRDAFLGCSDGEKRIESNAGELVDELGTMICGRFLSAVDPLSKINLAMPVKAERSELPAGALDNQQIWQGFVLDFGNLTTSVEFDSDDKAPE